jgi:hypothetical protein
MSFSLAKLGRFTLGLVASGSVAMFLAGSASAASPDVSAQTETQAVTTVNDQSTVSQTTSVTTVDSSVTPPEDGGSSGSGPSTTNDPKATPSDATLAATPATTSESVTPTSPLMGSETNHQSPASIPDVPVTSSTPLWQPQIITHMLLTSPVAAVSALATPVILTAPAAVDSIPQPPAPKTSGDLSALSRQLAGTVVPELFLGRTPLTAVMVSWLLAFALGLSFLLTQVRGFGYVYVLQRSGYSTAARSDVSPSSLFFATPLLNGLCSGPARSHGPFWWCQKSISTSDINVSNAF